MTDNEIIKALECCILSECENCPHDEETACKENLNQEILDLINRQKTKNNQLDETIQQLAEEINRQKAEVENQSENFKVLTSDHRTLQQSFDNLKGLYEAEKIKVAKAKEKCIGFAKELQTAKAELKETTEKFNCQQYVYTDLSDIIKEKNAEIEKLQADNSSMQSTLAKMSMGVEQAIAEAIKEFADVVEVVHGHNKTSMHPVDEFWCSVCGFCCADYTETKYDEDGDYTYSCECEFDYCPKCGAKMDGDKNG